VISKTAANLQKALGKKSDCHLRLCALDAIVLPQNKSLWELFGAILPRPTASVLAFKPPGSDLEILRSKSPQHSPVWVQHAFECATWGDFFFFGLFATLKVTDSNRL